MRQLFAALAFLVELARLRQPARPTPIHLGQAVAE